MRIKSLDDLISEVYKESSLFLEYTSQEAIDILKNYGINTNTFNLKDPVMLNALQRNLSNKYNPNNGGNADDFKKINAAFETLKNSSGGNQQPNNPEVSTYTPGNNQQPNNQQSNIQQLQADRRTEIANNPDKSPKFCTNCGKPVGKGARFCTHCGSPIKTA